MRTVTKRPAIFVAHSIRRMLARAKWMSRRICEERKEDARAEWKECLCREIDPADTPCMVCDYRFGAGSWGRPGGLVWVKEAWSTHQRGPRATPGILYAADNTFIPLSRTSDTAKLWRAQHARAATPWRNPMFMPKWAARLWFRIESIRFERLQSISEADAIAEGVDGIGPEMIRASSPPTARERFEGMWNELHGRGSWDNNPWVRVYTFTMVETAEALAA